LASGGEVLSCLRSSELSAQSSSELPFTGRNSFHDGEAAVFQRSVDRSAFDGANAVARELVAVPRALIVDDDPEIRRALARLLRPELEVCLAGSVAQAEALLARLDRVDVAFIDWELPDGTGEEILERLAHWPDAIRVLISARVVSSENPLKNRALANLVLGKPLAAGVVEALKRAALALPHG
jgi:CheY-like chemotaxis protein